MAYLLDDNTFKKFNIFFDIICRVINHDANQTVYDLYKNVKKNKKIDPFYLSRLLNDLQPSEDEFNLIHKLKQEGYKECKKCNNWVKPKIYLGPSSFNLDYHWVCSVSCTHCNFECTSKADYKRGIINENNIKKALYENTMRQWELGCIE